jgi:hypothetical protein
MRQEDRGRQPETRMRQEDRRRQPKTRNETGE